MRKKKLGHPCSESSSFSSLLWQTRPIRLVYKSESECWTGFPIFPNAVVQAAAQHTRVMAIDCFLDKKRSVVFTTFWGSVSIAQLERHAKKLVANLDFQPTFSQIVDLRELVSTDIGFRSLSHFSDPFSESSRRAVVTATDFVFGIARMYQGMRGNPDNFMFFRDVTTARRWLGLDQ